MIFTSLFLCKIFNQPAQYQDSLWHFETKFAFVFSPLPCYPISLTLPCTFSFFSCAYDCWPPTSLAPLPSYSFPFQFHSLSPHLHYLHINKQGSAQERECVIFVRISEFLLSILCRSIHFPADFVISLFIVVKSLLYLYIIYHIFIIPSSIGGMLVPFP